MLVSNRVAGIESASAAERPSLTPLDSDSGSFSAIPVGRRLDALDDLFDNQQGIYGVVVIDGRGELRYSRNASLPFVAASLYKLVLAADILARTTTAEIPINLSLPLPAEYFPADPALPDSVYSWDQIGTETTVDQALWAMVSVSSNVAAMALLALTSKDALNRRAASFGMSDTQYFASIEELADWRNPQPERALEPQFPEALAIVEAEALGWTVNVTSPTDIARFFTSLVHHQIVSATVSASLLDLLKGQLISDRMPAALPPGTSIAHKTGNLVGIVHDAGAIYSQNGPVVLVAMSEGVANEQAATWAIQEASRLTYDALIAFDGDRSSLLPAV